MCESIWGSSTGDQNQPRSTQEKLKTPPQTRAHNINGFQIASCIYSVTLKPDIKPFKHNFC